MIYVWMVSLVAATSGLLFGFDIAVINGAIVFLKQQWGLTELQTELAASALLAGCIVGAAVGGWFSDRYGRKIVLMVSAILFAISALGAALPRNLTEFAVARVLGGVAIGVASVLAPMYIAEVSPARMRGKLVSLNQMAIVTGILMAYFTNWVLSFQGDQSWRWMFAVAAAPALFFMVALFFVPESPRWLVEMGHDKEALRILTRVNGETLAGEELAQIKDAVAEETGSWSELLQPGVRRALFIAIVLAVTQQWTGVNSVIFYGSVILKDIVGGQSASSALGANVLIGGVNFVATIIAIALIDRVGRKALLIFSSTVMGMSLVGLAMVFRMPQPPPALVVLLMLMTTGSFAVGLGPGVWVVLSEIFPNRIRGRAMSIATLSLWVACTVLTMTFLSVATALGPTGAFLIYAGVCAFTSWFVWKITPETKHRTLEEIEAFWKVKEQ